MTKPLIPGGYILLSRKLIESEIFKKPPLYLKVWIYLLSQAQHQDYKKLKRGELRTSIPEIIEACSWYVGYRKEKPTKDQVYQIIEWLRNPNGRNSRNPCESNCESNDNPTMITTTRATHGLLTNIVRYDFYQTSKNYESNAEGNNENDTNPIREQRQPDNINKNDKNGKNDTNISSCSEDEVKKEPQLKFPVESTEYKLADFLRRWITKNNPKAKVPDDKKMDSWAQHIDYMIRLDKRDPEDIRTVIEFCQKDSFWMTNILSTTKLRKQFDQLYLKSQQGHKQQNQAPSVKTKFHLAKSRGDKYTADELEQIVLNNQKKKLQQN